MVFDSEDFVFEAPPAIARARRVLIKPVAGYPVGYPITTSREMMVSIIMGIRQISDADILILEGTSTGAPVAPMYQALRYDFPRVLTLDVRDTTLVEVENPLLKPLVMPTFMVPNVILSSDYLISVTPLKVIGGLGRLTIANLLGLIPATKYGTGTRGGWEELYALGIDKVLSDLFYTMPFDLGIIEADQKFISKNDPAKGEKEPVGKIFVGEPYRVDVEASQSLGIKMDYIKLIDEARVDLEV
ncbi:MAG: hypothetical protein C4542_01940 [Dehalococcoidia bacterium]|nr:MAG: hypothetical protein C4542_01940 [Dehalococcoidia bacterium]